MINIILFSDSLIRRCLALADTKLEEYFKFKKGLGKKIRNETIIYTCITNLSFRLCKSRLPHLIHDPHQVAAPYFPEVFFGIALLQ